ncbi:hypothetical protein BLAT2472_40379 [Burkholderia latens]
MRRADRDRPAYQRLDQAREQIRDHHMPVDDVRLDLPERPSKPNHQRHEARRTLGRVHFDKPNAPRDALPVRPFERDDHDLVLLPRVRGREIGDLSFCPADTHRRADEYDLQSRSPTESDGH